MDIKRSIDVEYAIKLLLDSMLTAYCRPLPADYSLPNILISQVGGSDENDVDTFEIVLDARAETEADANEYMRNAIGILKAKAGLPDNEIRSVRVTSSGSWGADPVRPDLAMYSSRLSVVAHLEQTTI